MIDYQDTWPSTAAALTASIRDALGDQAIRIDHIGSTAVPGLASKNVIDLQLTVHDLEPIERIVGPLAPLGFEFRPANDSDHVPPWHSGDPDDWMKRYCSKRGHPRAHLHIRALGRPNQIYALLFRDYLRAVPNAAAAYASFKRKLSTIDVDYVDVKDSMCDMIVVAAKDWADRTEWVP
jgi:GrpB-like predicted nucleotidyltransferase (UPF0157 family)